MIDNQPSTKKKSGLSPAVFFTLLAATMIVFVVPSVVYFNNLRRESKQQKIIHFLIDDYSESAQKGDINLAQEHCKASSKLYLKGDTLLQIAFANRPEVLINQVLDTNLAPGVPLVNCKQEYTPSNKVGDDLGTSLTSVMEYVQTLVRNTRAKNAQQPIIITITIENAELDLEGKSQETEARFEKLRGIVLNITCNENILKKNTSKDLTQMICNESVNNGIYLRIIGPIDELQRGLAKHIGNLSSVDICTRNGIDKCIKKVFESARQEKI